MAWTPGAFGGTAVTLCASTGFVAIPRLTWEDYWRLPERESAVCPICEMPGSSVDSVWFCIGTQGHAAMWRWPGVIGMD